MLDNPHKISPVIAVYHDLSRSHLDPDYKMYLIFVPTSH